MHRSWIALGTGLFAIGLFALGCNTASVQGGGDNTGGFGGASSSSSGGVAGSDSTGGSGGKGGGIEPTGSGGNGGAGAGSGSSGTGGNLGYMSCKECQSEATGAPKNECATEWQACMQWKTCVSYYNCNTFGLSGGPGPCDKTSIDGACCSLQCESTFADPEGIARYRALDACINCQTCIELCNNGPTYCAVFEPGGDALCPP